MRHTTAMHLLQSGVDIAVIEAIRTPRSRRHNRDSDHVLREGGTEPQRSSESLSRQGSASVLGALQGSDSLLMSAGGIKIALSWDAGPLAPGSLIPISASGLKKDPAVQAIIGGKQMPSRHHLILQQGTRDLQSGW